jgi:nucleoside-diphosphate-sugar epimerase
MHGDGTSLWTLTDHRDFAHAFVGLLGNDKAIAEEFHITSDDVLSWNQIHSFIASAAGLDPERVYEQTVFVPTDLLVRFDKEAFEGPIKGDKANAAIFDNAKVRSLVPDYRTQHHFEETVHESITWFMEKAERRSIDAAANALYDDVCGRYLRGVGTMFS